MAWERHASGPGAALLVPPVAWSIYFALVYGIAAIACEHAATSARFEPVAALWATMAVLTLLALLPMLWTGGAALARLRRGDRSFVPRIAAPMAAAFIVATLFLAVPIAWLELPCR